MSRTPMEAPLQRLDAASATLASIQPPTNWAANSATASVPAATLRPVFAQAASPPPTSPSQAASLAVTAAQAAIPQAA